MTSALALVALHLVAAVVQAVRAERVQAVMAQASALVAQAGENTKVKDIMVLSGLIVLCVVEAVHAKYVMAVVLLDSILPTR